jgi:hypothetical protein
MRRIRQDWVAIKGVLGGYDDGALVIIASLITACMRSLTVTTTKLSALEMLVEVGQCVGDDFILDRLLPYVVAFLSDHLALVRATALRSLALLVSRVHTVRVSDVSIFPEYIFPALQEFPHDEEVGVGVGCGPLTHTHTHTHTRSSCGLRMQRASRCLPRLRCGSWRFRS